MNRIRFRYLSIRQPPAPFVSVTITDENGSRSLSDRPAQLDNAADRTVIPGSFVEQLGLVSNRSIDVAGLGGNIETLSLYRVRIILPTFRAVSVDVVAHPAEEYILLGRDLLNRYMITMDGPNLDLVVEEP
jgi:hypothetical protein